MTIDAAIEAPGALATFERAVSRTRRNSRFADTAGHAVMLALVLLSIFPIYWMIVSSLRPDNEIFDTSLLPASPSLENYRFVLESIPMVRMLVNTTIVSLVVSLFHVITGLMAAYAYVRWRFPLDRLTYGLIALTWLVPFQVTMIPNYVLVTQMGMLDSILGLIIPHVASAFSVMMLYQAVRSFPKEVIEAARMDGAGEWRILLQVVAPNLKASLASLTILGFISTWNDYFWPLLLSRKPENSVVQIGLQMFMTQEGNLWGPLMAASTLACLPILIIYIALQRHVIEAFMRSGMR